jgi:hypothetical protein
MTMKDVGKKDLRGFIKLHPDKLDWMAAVVIGSYILGMICWQFHISPSDIVTLKVLSLCQRHEKGVQA